jgi:transcription-repair coupling factor (superfamily II helicase)
MQEQREPFWDFLPERTVAWLCNTSQIVDILDKTMKEAQVAYDSLTSEIAHLPPNKLFTSGQQFREGILKFRTIQMGTENAFDAEKMIFNTVAQPDFNKNFNMLADTIRSNENHGVKTFIFSDNSQQQHRLKAIFDDFEQKDGVPIHYQLVPCPIHGGFIDNNLKIACFAEHQIFGRFHRVKLRDHFTGREAATIKEL